MFHVITVSLPVNFQTHDKSERLLPYQHSWKSMGSDGQTAQRNAYRWDSV